VAGHRAGLELPSLHWFYGFGSAAESLREASWWPSNRGEVIGHGMCGLLAAVGVALLIGSRRGFRWNPQTVRMFRRFRSIRRGYVSLLMLLVLLVLALLDQVLVGKRALLVKYGGEYHAPAITQRRFLDRDFGGTGESEVDYRELRARFRAEGEGNWVVLPPVPFEATFDSEEELRVGLVEREGHYFREGEQRPYSGLAYRFYADDPGRRHSMLRFRRGVPQAGRSSTSATGISRGSSSGRTGGGGASPGWGRAGWRRSRGRPPPRCWPSPSPPCRRACGAGTSSGPTRGAGTCWPRFTGVCRW